MNKKRIINSVLLIVVLVLVIIVVSKTHFVKYEYADVPVIAQSDALFIEYYNSSIPLTSLEETESAVVLDTMSETEETEILNVSETEATDKFDLKTVNFPIVEGKELGRIIGFVDKNTALCGMEDLDSDTLNDMTELGYWHLDTGTYSTMSTVQGGWWYLVAHNEEYMFFDVMYNLNGGLNDDKGQLMCYDRDNESWKIILAYSESEDGVAYIAKHQRLIHDGYLYFEDNLPISAGVSTSTAYRLNLGTMELENLGQNLKNPQLYEGDIWYIETTQVGQALKNIETGATVELPWKVSQIALIGDALWVMYDTGLYSAQTTVSMKEGADANIVGIPTASVFQSTDYIAWESSTIDVPKLYSKKKQQVISIDEISVGSHFYYLQDDYGLIESWIPRGNEPSEVIYTFFERVD